MYHKQGASSTAEKKKSISCMCWVVKRDIKMVKFATNKNRYKEKVTRTGHVNTMFISLAVMELALK